ncbi:MAG: ABC transporter ATP-binding protein [Armatimonadetes bacterium]|nr:ABC transporter ATP-binding protein [Armatimonadota bacterium]
MVDGDALLKFDHVGHSYLRKGQEPVMAIKEIDFQVTKDEDGEFIAIVGPSGCGKSTLLNMISGLLLPSHGKVYIMGEQVVGPTVQAVTVQQAYTCFPWRTVLGNVTFGLELMGAPQDETQDTARKYLGMVGLADRENAYPRELSGGMQQRVAIARALALKRPVLLMDEPFGALDAQTRADMQRLIVDIWQQERSLIVFVTHDIMEALLLADRVLVLSPRPSQIVLDTMISFARPRTLAIQTEPNFQRLHQAILNMLKSPAPNGVPQGGPAK